MSVPVLRRHFELQASSGLAEQPDFTMPEDFMTLQSLTLPELSFLEAYSSLI